LQIQLIKYFYTVRFSETPILYPIYSTYQHQSKAFEPEQLATYRLRVLIRDGMLLYVVLSSASKVLAVREYRSHEPLGIGEFFERIYQQDYFLKEDYDSVEIVNGTLSFSLIPSRYFAPQRMKEFAGALIKDSFDTEHLAYRAIDEDKATAIFLVPGQVKEKFDAHFQGPDFLPACQPLIKMAHRISEAHPDLVLVTLFQNQFVITALRKGQLRICNTYDFQAAYDMVYFIQLIQDLLELQERPTVFLHGDFDPQSDFFRDLKGFLPELQTTSPILENRFEGDASPLLQSKYAYLTF